MVTFGFSSIRHHRYKHVVPVNRICVVMSCVELSRVVRKPAFCICENKDADQLRGTAKLISAFVFATRIVQFLFYLKPKFPASSRLLWLYSPIYIGPGRKPRRQVFSQRDSILYGEIPLNCLRFVIQTISPELITTQILLTGMKRLKPVSPKMPENQI